MAPVALRHAVFHQVEDALAAERLAFAGDQLVLRKASSSTSSVLGAD